MVINIAADIAESQIVFSIQRACCLMVVVLIDNDTEPFLGLNLIEKLTSDRVDMVMQELVCDFFQLSSIELVRFCENITDFP